MTATLESMAESDPAESLTIGGVTVYTLKGAADLLGIDPSRVSRAARRRGIGQRFGRQSVFTAADIEALRDRPHGVRVVD